MIQLTKNLWMDADDNQYIVGKLNKGCRKDAQGHRKDKLLLNPRYYPTAAMAVSAALSITMRQGVADGSITTLREFVEEQKRQRAELEKLIVPLE